MLTCPTSLPIDFCTTPVDFRQSFDGLTGVLGTIAGELHIHHEKGCQVGALDQRAKRRHGHVKPGAALSAGSK